MSKKSLIIPVNVLLAAAGLLFGVAGHWTSWQGSCHDQEADDANLKVDTTPMSTRISGTVRRVSGGDYQSVKAESSVSRQSRSALSRQRFTIRAFAARQRDGQLHEGRSESADQDCVSPGQPCRERLRPRFSAVVIFHALKAGAGSDGDR
jgi:hypothetical protein